MPRTSDTERATKLLAKAVRMLQPSEQDVVLRHLLGTQLGTQPTSGGGSEAQALGALLAGPPVGSFGPSSLRHAAGPGSEHRMVPVRLPDPLYARLKAWCSDNGFSMAVVVRGLVERFLDQQGQPDAASPVA